MSGPADPDRLTATYRLRVASGSEASDLAEAIAREQTVEVPPGVGGKALQARMVGRVESIAAAPGPVTDWDAEVSYSAEVTGAQLVQVLNVAYGNVSLMPGVALVDLALPAQALEAAPGPRFGVEGLRRLVGATDGRPLLSTAIKPVGSTVSELARLAATFARAGVDVVKDDHGLVDQRAAPFRERVEAVARAVAEANDEVGSRCAYFPNVTGPVDSLDERIGFARERGCAGMMLCPSLLGLDVVRAVASAEHGLAIMAHPTHGATSPGRSEGMAPEVLFGTLYRVAGADVVVYVNAEGRFAWPLETCHAINERLRSPLGSLAAALPAPAGGVAAEDGARWAAEYGPDTMLLIGGSLLARDDLHAATVELVAAVRGASPRPTATGAVD